MGKQAENFRPLVLILVAMMLGMIGGVALDRDVLAVFAQPPANTPNAFDVNLINQAWGIIQRSYVDQSAVKPKELTYAAIEGMTNALGDTGHTRFMTPDMVNAENDFTQGQFEGIGAQVESKDGHTVIVAPIEGSPAEKAGLHAGDIILAVNGEKVDGLPIAQVVSKVKGPAGSSVRLTIQDPKTGASRELVITRAKIALKNVTWTMVPGTHTAHIYLAGFSQGVAQDLQDALTAAQKEGATGVVLDLRNNPGGLLDESVGTASEFLKSGDVLLVKNAQGQVTHMGVKPGGVAPDVPLVVLVNNGTASAAEIVAGALQDAKRAKLVGETTYGTGTVLNQFGLADGSALLVATEEWLTPSGRVIWHKGIAPDVSVALSANSAPLMPTAEKGMTASQIESSGDAQLLQALDLLHTSAQKTP